MNGDDPYTCPIKLAFIGKLRYEDTVQHPRKVLCAIMPSLIGIEQDKVQSEELPIHGHIDYFQKPRQVSCTSIM